MDGGNNADSDHSMTWEDFFGSTTDLTPTLIGIYDSLLEPARESGANTFHFTPSETADRPAPQPPARKHHQTTTQLKLPKFLNRNRFSPIRTSSENVSEDVSDNKGGPVEAINVAIVSKEDAKMITEYRRTKIDTKEETEMIAEYRRTKIDTKEETEMITEYRRTKINVEPGMSKTDLFKRRAVDMSSANSGFENLSPNVKRMISSASTESQSIFQPKKLSAVSKPTFRKVSHIPLVGATSKISHSGVDIIPSVDIYDQPYNVKTKGTAEKINDIDENEEVCLTARVISRNEKAVKSPIFPDRDSIYDVPTNSQAIYDVPSVNTKAVPFDNLSLPFIDQSLEFNSSSSYREFDPKLGSKENSPSKNDAEDSHDVVKKSEASAVNGVKDYSKTDVGKATAPVTVEVSRPLSMSSIASSSSTSSSGAQNKGGVNSAYLASIESLDDHSDADMVSRRGSDNFDGGPGGGSGNGFAEMGLGSQDPRETPAEGVVGVTQLQRVCEEIVETERVYVDDLRQVIEGYLHTWRREGTFSEEQLSEIFGNIEDIYEFNRSLLAALESHRAHAQSLARALAARARSFGVYTTYCTRYPRTMAALAALAAARPEAARDTQLRLGHPLPLASYLLKPVQRILKYHLLLQNLVKHCKSEETEYALLKMTGIAQHIDDMKRKHEHAVRVQEIQSLLYGWNGLDLTTYGELCAEGTFRVFGAKAMRHAFLFDKMLLITKSREDGVLAYKCHIMCNNLMLVEVVSGAPLSFHVIPWDSPRGQLTLQARSQRHKREWTLLLKRVILENYNAVIPSHARQLVMELGQNRTDDQILAEKSNILMSHASMRKQLSAPEYLEKRKMDRDRRKSLEGGIRNRLKKTARKNALQNTPPQDPSRDCSCLDSQTCGRCQLCSDCEIELSNGDLSKKREDSPVLSAKLSSSSSTFYGTQRKGEEKCAECDQSLHYIDATSTDEFTRQHSTCSKCSSDFRSSQESCCVDTDGKDDSNLSINSCHCQNAGKNSFNVDYELNIKRMHKTCLKCSKIRENIAQTSTETISHPRKSRCADMQVSHVDSGRSKSKEDLHRSKLPKISTWRRKSEPGFQQSIAELDNGSLLKKCGEAKEKEATHDPLCRNCGNAVHHNEESKPRAPYTSHTLRPTKLENELSHKFDEQMKYNTLDIKMYNTKHLPKKISRIKKIRAKNMKDPTAKFYADLPTDNVLHISESTDSVNTVNSTNSPEQTRKEIPTIEDKCKTDQEIDEETYRKLIEKTDSFKKSELEKVKFLSKQNVINEHSDGDEIDNRVEVETTERRKPEEDAEGVSESCEESEKPLEQIISQLLMQNREFQKILKKHQLRNSSQRRHQRLLKSHSNPEKVIAAHSKEQIKFKPKYGRQTSAGESTRPGFEENLAEPQNTRLSPAAEIAGESDEEHIYETLRVDTRHDNNLHGLSAKSKPIQHSNRNSLQRPKRIPSPGSIANESAKVSDDTRQSILESDYVYLAYNNKMPKVESTFSDDGLYAVPTTYKNAEAENGNDDYVTINRKEEVTATENVYDRLTDVWQRPSELNCAPAEGYLAMKQDQESPNQPAIWLDRQKEHFNISCDRKSGSLPRSFQVVVNGNDESTLDCFKANNTSNKIYINKDGKVLSTDRPFTIASDKSDISYEDVESFMGEDGSVMKFNKMASLNRGSRTFYRSDNADVVGDSLSKSTLELEEEIDQCYKKNFIENVDNIDELTSNDVNYLNVSDQNLNQTISSSCEVLPGRAGIDDDENDILHPEHRIYKPSSHLMAFKNVLNRFKPKTPLKVSESADESNAEEVGSPEKVTARRSALNPRNYSKNLMQRFKNIIGDEGVNEHGANKLKKSLVASDIKVLVTSTEDLTKNSFETETDNDILSKSVCETPNRTPTQSNMEHLSRSCDNIGLKLNELRPKFDKCHSMTSSIPVTSSPIKSLLLLGHNLSKLPIYKQGSAHLGARIAQSDYADPQTLFKEESRSGLENVNVLINKNALRPDSLLSNSSHFTSSSDGNTNTGGNDSKTNLPDGNASVTMRKDCRLDISERDIDKGDSDSSPVANSDDSFYEKSFEKIEDMEDIEMFRDSAVYSDQEEVHETKVNNKMGTVAKSTYSNERVYSCKSVNVVRKDSIPIAQRRVQQRGNAPPVPVKPSFPKADLDVQRIQLKQRSISAVRSTQAISKTSEPKRNEKSAQNWKENFVQSQNRLESKIKTSVCENKVQKGEENGVQMKRLSIERCSLDSVSRRAKSVSKDMVLAGPGVKSVLERRMEIESITKGETLLSRPTNLRRFSQEQKEANVNKTSTKKESESEEKCNLSSSVSSVKSVQKFAYNRNVSVGRKSVDAKEEVSSSVVQVEQGEVQDSRESWVKQIVNKFQ